jgi:hypothetical protein
MQQTLKTLAAGVALATALAAPSAFAAQNVANTSQKGSLLIFPRIDVRPDLRYRTIIRITNDAYAAVNLKCYYVNHTKGRNDFQFTLTKKQAVIWDAATGEGDPTNVNAFPSREIGPYPGNPYAGELVCFAVNAAGSAQISWNHLSGTATVFNDANETAYEYNSWNFTARGGTLGRPFGEAGTLELTGADDGAAYDACPAYNIVHFTPYDLEIPNDTRVSVSSCWQDLRQDYALHLTKLQLTAWNSHEVRFTGAYHCANSTDSFLLSEIQTLPENTSATVLRTYAAHLQIRGVESTQCRGSADAGLVAVAASFSPSVATGVNANGAGVAPGRVKWDPTDPNDPPERR